MNLLVIYKAYIYFHDYILAIVNAGTHTAHA